MIEKFPYSQEKLRLCAADFNLFSKSFGQILQHKMPTSCSVSFCSGAESFRLLSETYMGAENPVSLFNQILRGEKSYGIEEGLLLVPFFVDGGCVVGVVSGADPVFLTKVAPDWLSGVLGEAEREFVLLKGARVDGLTGLLNLSNLHSLLDNARSIDNLSLILLELLPKRYSPPAVHRHITRCVSLLKKFLHDDSTLHYLGNCTFGLVLSEQKEQGENTILRSLVAYLRREGCHRVHAGGGNSGTVGADDSETAPRPGLLDAAWSALCHARKLGPFSFSNYTLLVRPEAHPLASPDRALIRKLRKQWAGRDSFCLVQFEVGQKGGCSHETLVPLLDRGRWVVHEGSVFLFLESADVKEVQQWLEKTIEAGAGQLGGKRVLAGIGRFPLLDCSRTEVVMQCRKALLHASFYDKNCAVVFDAVSLNVSGDIYFGEGNLNRAATEYRQGLRLSGGDVNLHNSLGVTLAQMNKLQAAHASFQQALSVDPDNFMSFYNLGLLEQHRGNTVAALDSFSRARQVFDDEEGQRDLLADLELQVGILSCVAGRYRQAVEQMQSWYRQNARQTGAERIFYYMGKAYSEIGDNRQSMNYLQKALRYDQFDVRAMSLLGLVYAREQQGNDIALSLCLKSVELEPAELQYKLQLAEVCFRSGMYREAKDNVYRCVRAKRTRLQAQFLLGRIYASEGKKQRAENWLAKVIAQTDDADEMHIEAEKMVLALQP